MVRKIDWKLLIISIIVCQLAGILGTLFTTPAIPEWYAGLTKPFFSPPNAVFGPVWTLLYTLMGISLYPVWVSRAKHKTKAYAIFIVQLVLNTLWSVIFFGFKNPGLALIEIILMWVSILLTIVLFARISKIASYLLYPYLGWVSFATLLNFYIWQLNK